MARPGPAPVARLAAVAEQVTATGDPGRWVEVDGTDGLGRLAASFNTMLSAARRDWPPTAFQAGLQPSHVTGSAERLRSAVRSLLDNAAKFSPPGAPVEVCLAGGELTVRDHGPGIAPADLPHVFDRFYRANTCALSPGALSPGEPRPRLGTGPVHRPPGRGEPRRDGPRRGPGRRGHGAAAGAASPVTGWPGYGRGG